MRLRYKTLLAPIFAALLGSASAATYEQNFDGLADGTTDLGDGTSLVGNANFTPSVVSGELHFTANTNSNNSALHFPAMADSSVGFAVSFNYRMSDPAGGNPPADGFSFSYGAIPFGTSSTLPEEGWPGITPCLSFEVDTWMVGDAEVGPAIALDEVDLAFTNGDIFADGETISGTMTITWEPATGASFTTTGATTNAEFVNVPTPGFTGDDSWGFALAARTGGANEDLFIDNIVITTGVLDSDGDGMSDAYEIANGLDPDDNGEDPNNNGVTGDPDQGADGDPDMDGIANIDERDAGTHPNKADTDDDGLNDNVEDGGGTYVGPDQTGTSPLNADTDDDGLLDGVENPTLPFVDADQPGTDPNNPNTDGDSLNDGEEIALGRNPTIDDDPPPPTSYSQNFDGIPDGTTELGDGSTFAGTATVADGALRLTENTNSNNAAFHIPAIANSSAGWTAKFSYSIMDNTGNPPADGFSFSYGSLPVGGLSGQAEEGWPGVTPCLSFEVDTWMNGDAEVGPAIAVDNVDVPGAFTNGNILEDDTMVEGEVCIVVQADGTASFTTTGAVTNADFADIATGFVLDDGFSFALAARTGGANEEVIIDNIEVFIGTGGTPLQMTEIEYDQGAEMFTLSWTAKEGKSYGLFWSETATDGWGNDIDDTINADNPLATFDGSIMTYGPFENPSPGAPLILFRAQEN